MITKQEAYKIAFAKKEEALKAKIRNRDMLLAAAYETEKRLPQIENELLKIGSQLAITAISGDTEKLEVLKKASAALGAEREALLKKCAVPEIMYDCPVCLDSGYVGGKICPCIVKEAAAFMAEELSKEMPLKNSTFEDFDLNYYKDTGSQDGENPHRRMTAILKLCREYALGFDPEKSANLLFIGRTGLGKTHLTLAIVSEVIKKGYLPIYGTAENIFTAIEKEKFDGEGKGSYDAILGCDLLVIDDLGTEMSTAFTRSAIYNIIDTRILSGKPTIINTNLSMKEIEQRYSERVASRFIGNYEWREFQGTDIRQQKTLIK